MDDIIPPYPSKDAVIAVEGNDVSSFGTSSESLVAFPRGHIPQEDITVLTRTCERGAITTEDHTNASSTTCAKSFSGVRIHIHQLNIAYPTTNCQSPTLTTIGNRRSTRITCVF